MAHRKQLERIPDLLALHRFKPDQYPYLLDSTTRGEVNTRYSLLMAYPVETLVQEASEDDCLQRIDTSLEQASQHPDLPFIGGWFVFLAYEYASLVEPSVEFYPDDSFPVAFISRIPAALIIDHQLNRASIVAQPGQQSLIARIVDDIEQAPPITDTELPACRVEEQNPEIYRRQLQRTQSYIRDGDIFQANLSRLWTAQFERAVDPVALYQRLRHSNPAPFAALIRHRGRYILSSSPERLISVKNGVVETRPIAGTHPRGQNSEEDKDLSSKLLQHPKERAEHVMLIDLERNDLGRICQPGSIQVQDRMMLESYQHVHHIVSAITGRMKPGQSVRDVLHAVFPGGTITGCPKVRCMQIIGELEQQARGAYTGSLGYVSDDGQMDFNILIRSMTLDEDQLRFRAGAGIVSDSQTEREITETRYKARGMINAIQADH